MTGRYDIFAEVIVTQGIEWIFQLSLPEILGIVGESGCGKSTLARMVLTLIRPIGLDRQHQAGIHGIPIQDTGAGTADPGITPLLGIGQPH